MEKISLNLAERIQLIGFLPKQGSFMVVNLAQELTRELAYSKEEVEKYNIRLNAQGNGYVWDPNKHTIKIQICGMLMDKIKDIVIQFDKEEKLTIDHIGVLNKIGINLEELLTNEEVK